MENINYKFNAIRILIVASYCSHLEVSFELGGIQSIHRRSYSPHPERKSIPLASYIRQAIKAYMKFGYVFNPKYPRSVVYATGQATRYIV